MPAKPAKPVDPPKITEVPVAAGIAVGHQGLGGYRVAAARDVESSGTGGTALRSNAVAGVERWSSDDDAWPSVLRLYERVTGESLRGPTAIDIDEHIKPRLQRALERGHLVAFDGAASTTLSTPAEQGVHGKKPEKVEAPPPKPKRPPRVAKEPPPELTFIEIVLVDDDGAPAAGERFEVRLPNGEIRSGTLDAEGKARVDGIPDGQCEVTFPDLDGRDWRR